MRIDKLEALIAELDAEDVQRVRAAAEARWGVPMSDERPTIDCPRCGATVNADEAAPGALISR